jgi:protein-disulfide isomerase
MLKRIFLSFITILTFVLMLGFVLPNAAAQDKPAKHVDVDLPSEETVNGFMRYTFGYDSGTTWKITKIQPSPYGLAEVNVAVAQKDQPPNGYRLLIAPDGAHVMVGDVIPFGAKPFAPARRLLDAGAKGPSKGAATAPVTIVEFSDFQCPHCKDVQPAIEKLLAAHPEIRFVFQNYPLPMHDWSRKAASYADCVANSSKPDAFWKFVGDVFEAQAQITASNADEKLTAIADGTGVKGADIAVCAAVPATDGHVQKSIDLGNAAEVASTPTFFINGRKMGNLSGVPDNVMNEILDFHAKEDK